MLKLTRPEDLSTQACLVSHKSPKRCFLDEISLKSYCTVFKLTNGRIHVWVRLGSNGMSRQCELTGKKVMSGHKVSHSNRKTKRKFRPNLCSVSLTSETLGRTLRLRVSAAGLRTVEHRGGLDAFLLKANDDELSREALKLKRDLKQTQA